jgi:hypothetical protein
MANSSDGSAKYNKKGGKRVTYGFAVYQDRKQLHTGRGSFHPSLLFVHPFSETLITQTSGMLVSLYQPERWCLPCEMIKGGMAQHIVLMPSMVLVHFRSPCCTVFGCPRRSESVTTAVVDMTPIVKPDSSELYVALSMMPCLALVFSTKRN